MVFIDEKDWPTIQQIIQNLLSMKMANIEFTNISDIRIIETIPKIFPKESNYASPLSCNMYGCLRVLGKIIFSVDCPLICQIRKINKTNTFNLIQPSITLNLNSTSNKNYRIELDEFTIAIVKGQESDDQLTVFMLYSLIGNRIRSSLSGVALVDDSSLINITRLVDNSISKSQMDINRFIVLQAEIIRESSTLNVTVLFTFNSRCVIDCQHVQINKLKNTSLINFNPVVMIYDGGIHFHNVSLIVLHNTTTETTTNSFQDLIRLIFEANYKLEPFDLRIDGDLKTGPIVDSLTLSDLTNMMQTTLSKDSNITVYVFNATIDMDNLNYTVKPISSDSMKYILRLIVYYIYSAKCNTCMDICNHAVYSEPVLNNEIEIRNAFLIDISRPMSVIHINSISTVQYTTTHPNDYHTIKITNVTVVTAANSQHTTIEHTSTTHHTSEYKSTTLHTTTSTHTLK